MRIFKLHKLSCIKLASLAVLVSPLFAAQAHAGDCENNFSVSGNYLAGKVYKTWVNLPGTQFTSAFNGAYQYTARNGWKMLKADQQGGIISAAQAGLYAKGKVVPLDIVFEKADKGVKVSITYATPSLVSSPDAAVKLDFCKTVASAEASKDNSVMAVEATQSNGTAAATAAVAEPQNQGASEFVKNGKPCLGGICIGDDISSLGKIKWDEAVMFNSGTWTRAITIRPEGQSFNSFAKKFAANENTTETLKKAYPYLTSKTFDNDGIPKLAKVKGYCAYTSVSGHFKSESGFRTDVEVEVVPGENPAQQAFRVITIGREYPVANYTRDQLKEIASQFRTRYKGVQEGVDVIHKPDVIWRMDANILLLADQVHGNYRSDDNYKRFPGCTQLSLKLD